MWMISSFFVRRAKKASAKDWCPPQELEVGPRSRPYLLVYFNIREVWKLNIFSSLRKVDIKGFQYNQTCQGHKVKAEKSCQYYKCNIVFSYRLYYVICIRVSANSYPPLRPNKIRDKVAEPPSLQIGIGVQVKIWRVFMTQEVVANYSVIIKQIKNYNLSVFLFFILLQ